MNAFKTVTAYNSQELEGKLFGQKVDTVFQLAKKEAYMTGVFWGMSGLTGNLALLCLLGYGTPLSYPSRIDTSMLTARWYTCVSWGHLGRRPHLAPDVQRVSRA